MEDILSPESIEFYQEQGYDIREDMNDLEIEEVLIQIESNRY